MYVVILAGGSGTRLWPLSRELFPKQYLSLPIAGAGTAEKTLFEATFDRVTTAVSPLNIVVVTHCDQAAEVRRQLDGAGLSQVLVLKEPQARNTAAAIGLAACYLQGEAGPDAVMAVLPSDHLIKDHARFNELLLTGRAAAQQYGLVTFGIRPTYPETGYGYICCGEKLDQSTHSVAKFAEKPDLETAKNYLEDSRYLWNSGMFVFRVDALLEQYSKHLPEMYNALYKIDYYKFSNLEEIYQTLEKISIDYGILECADGVTVIPADIDWSDLGSWEAFYQVAPRDEEGNYIKGRVIPVDTENSLIISDQRLIGTAGIKDLVIVDTADALLVCDRKQTQDVKKIVDQLSAQGAKEAREHQTVYRPWGSYTSLEIGDKYQVKRINVNPGSRLSLQSHRHRSENWVVVNGEAYVTINDQQFTVQQGEHIFVPTGARHRMENKGEEPLVFIEVQSGKYLGEDDIERFEDDYGRTDAAGETSCGGDNPAKPSSLPAADANPAQLARQRFEQWLAHPELEADMRRELLAMQDDAEQIQNHFGSELVFGTGGMRGVIGPGLNRINRYIIRRATQGLADYLNKLAAASPSSEGSAGDGDSSKEASLKVAIAYDTRRYSPEFAEAAAGVLAANGIKALLFNDIRPTPVLSYATRELGCAAGIVITASHNPPQYNGYKVYGPDGGQAVSPLVDDLVEAITAVDMFHDVQTMPREEAIAKGLMETIDPALDQSYLEKVKALSLSKPRENIKVVFTPLHGTGEVYIPTLLAEPDYIALFPVEEQSNPDSEFSTVEVPNPEDPAALDMALAKARSVEADLVLATDPDGDRVGTAIRDHRSDYVILSGNQVGALLIEYICSRLMEQEAMPAEPALIKTIVTGDLGRRIAESYGLQVIETLTGFKFIGERIKELEARGTPRFIFGYEESCGYLSGTFVRDKDAIIAAHLIAEMTAYYKEYGKNLLQVLDELQQRFGYHYEDLFTIELEDISEAGRHVAAYHALPAQLGGLQVVEKRDYEQGKGWDLQSGREYELTLPRSPVLHFSLEDGSWFAVRPSGTEPKVKFYLSVTAPEAFAAEQKLARLREAVLEIK